MGRETPATTPDPPFLLDPPMQFLFRERESCYHKTHVVIGLEKKFEPIKLINSVYGCEVDLFTMVVWKKKPKSS